MPHLDADGAEVYVPRRTKARKDLIMRKLSLLGVAAGLLFAAVLHSDDVRQDTRIPAFITSSAATGGFTDPDKSRTDSTKDLIEKIKGSRTVRLVSADEAVIVLEVMGRD